MEKKTIIVVGAGPGLGNAVARRFGHEGYRSVLIARSAPALNGYVKELADEGMEACGIPADATDATSLAAALSEAKNRFGAPDVVVYNVGITTPDENPLTYDDLMRHFATDVAGAHECIRLVADDDFAKKKGAIILTGGYAAENPFPGYLCLALDKAALRNLAFAKNAELADKSIFVGTVMVCGGIAPDTHFAPELIAENYWKMNAERSQVETRYE